MVKLLSHSSAIWHSSYCNLLVAFRCDEAHHSTAVKLRGFLNRTKLGTSCCKPIKQLTAEGSMRHFASAESNTDLNLVAILKKTLCMINFNVQIVVTDTDGKPKLLDINNFLILTCFFFTLRLLKSEFTVVHNAAYGGDGLRSDLYKIQAFGDGEVLGFLDRHDTELSSILTDNTYFFVSDLLIDLMLNTANANAPPKLIKKSSHRLLFRLTNYKPKRSVKVQSICV